MKLVILYGKNGAIIMNICIIGSGYIGIVSGVVFADLGNNVICVDNDKNKVAQLSNCKPTIYEPGLEEMMQRNFKEGRLKFTSNLKKAIRLSEIVFICVGTPAKDNGETDLIYIKQVAKDIGKYMNKYITIIVKSTVPVGSGDMVEKIIKENQSTPIEFDIASNPEFLKEGSAIHDTLCPDRIIIGSSKKKVAMKLFELYASLEKPILVTDIHSAEIIKYASNAFLATKISFINSIANLCEKTGADVLKVAKGMGYDKRIGKDFLQAGIGYAGSCFPKDTQSLVYVAKEKNCDMSIVQSTIEINNEAVSLFVDKIREKFSNKFKDKTIGILGLSFKPNTDDLRYAKSIEIIDYLLLKQVKSIKVYDPIAMSNFQKLESEIFKNNKKIKYCKKSYDVAKNADALILVTEWREFKFIDFNKIYKLMKQPNIFDGRNFLDKKRLIEIGFEYYGVGR